MRYFIDFEFIEDGRTIEPLSLGMVAEGGRELYIICNWTDRRRANDWVKANVLPNIEFADYMPDLDYFEAANPEQAADKILEFIGADLTPEFWGYYSAYDWVAFCQLFGAMIDLPRGWPMYCHDLKQFIDEYGLSVQQDDSTHNALEDARWVKRTWEEVCTYKEGLECPYC